MVNGRNGFVRLRAGTAAAERVGPAQALNLQLRGCNVGGPPQNTGEYACLAAMKSVTSGRPLDLRALPS